MHLSNPITNEEPIMTKTRIEKLIEDKESRGETKDIPFLASLQSWYARSGQLSEKQSAALAKIEYLSSAAGRQEVKDWQSEYLTVHKPRAKICATYYLSNPPYFHDLANNIMTNPEFVPTQRQFEAMCKNKFTNRVWSESQRTPRFAKGDIVKVREIQQLPYQLYHFRGKLAIVVENTGEVTTHAIGGRVYKLLPFGHASMIACQERHIKSFTNKEGKENEHE